MKPMLDQAFWSDPEIEASKSGVKLAALWLITNSQTSLLGICGASVTRFKFETGLPEEALQRALEALPRSFSKIGSVVFVRNYIRHQFGTGDKLTKNNFFVALKSLFLSVKDEELRAAILNEYPEFQKALSKGFEGLTKPKGREEQEGEGEESKGSPEGKPATPGVPAFPAGLMAIDGFKAEWDAFVSHRRKMKKPLTDRAIELTMAKLAVRPGSAIAALQMAIEKGWQSITWEWFDNANGVTPTPAKAAPKPLVYIGESGI